MRVYSVFAVAVAVLLSSSDAAADTDVGQIKSKTTDVLSPDGVPSVQSPADVVTRQRSLRIGATDDADDVDETEDSEEEERAGGTEIVMMAHGLPRADAKMVRQIAKGNSPAHILDKHKVPFEVINGERVYSRYDKDYQRYVKWLKRANDNPLTYGRR